MTKLKEEALNLADQLDGLNSCEPVIIKACEDMIRRLVEELDKQGEPEQRKLTEREHSVMQKALMRSSKLITPQTKPLSDDEIVTIWEKANYESQYYEASDNFAIEFARAIEERHGIK